MNGPSLSLAPCSPCSLPDELLSSQEKTSAVKDVVVSIDMSKDSDGDSSKLSSKATSLQNSPAVQKGLQPSINDTKETSSRGHPPKTPLSQWRRNHGRRPKIYWPF